MADVLGGQKSSGKAECEEQGNREARGGGWKAMLEVSHIVSHACIG